MQEQNTHNAPVWGTEMVPGSFSTNVPVTFLICNNHLNSQRLMDGSRFPFRSLITTNTFLLVSLWDMLGDKQVSNKPRI